MKPADRLLQHWRISKIAPLVRSGARLLDVGCSDAALARQIPDIQEYVGIDPEPLVPAPASNWHIHRGFFPRDLPPTRPFDVITMLAALEHVPLDQQPSLARAMYDHLENGGLLLITVPHPLVDRILDVLQYLRLIDGIAIEQHYGFDVERTADLFRGAGFDLIRRSRFQLGLNNLFVFRKPRRSPPDPIAQ